MSLTTLFSFIYYGDFTDIFISISCMLRLSHLLSSFIRNWCLFNFLCYVSDTCVRAIGCFILVMDFLVISFTTELFIEYFLRMILFSVPSQNSMLICTLFSIALILSFSVSLYCDIAHSSMPESSFLNYHSLHSPPHLRLILSSYFSIAVIIIVFIFDQTIWVQFYKSSCSSY